MRTAAAALSMTILAALLSGCETEEYRGRDDYRSVEDVRADWDYNRQVSAREHADFRLYLENYAEKRGKTTLELNGTERANARRSFRREFGWKYQYRRLPYRPADDRGYYDRSYPPPPAYRPYHYDDDSWW